MSVSSKDVDKLPSTKRGISKIYLGLLIINVVNVLRNFNFEYTFTDTINF